MSTDYVNYAVVYGCEQLDSKGLCLLADSWIWSRYTEIPDNKKALVESKKQELCVNTTMYLPTAQNNSKQTYHSNSHLYQNIRGLCTFGKV